ncbi:MAG: phosphoribosylanthranilate isomerase [Betaproteobacteria bacterium]|nr:phosphoribosylanthranilate isomerase [Betaproteobacteria bacterium]MDE2623174.1 phosphoribosylanthranilate isomerase [Betaproteobacteria bacterium]
MRTRVKICGITRPEEARAAVRAGADAIGLVFHASSPRALEVEQAAEIVASLPPFVSAVGLFVDAPAARIESVLSRVRLDCLQFHGNEAPAECERFDVPYIKVARVRAGFDLIQYAVEYRHARAILVDAYVPGQPGGTGRTFDWGLLPEGLPLPLILSGGLAPDNVARAVRTVHPWAVDVSSGVESAPGRKDPEKVLQFIEEVRNEDLRHA